MRSLDAFALGKLDRLEAANRRRRLREVAREPDGRVVADGRAMVSLSCNDTLGLSRHPSVVAAAREATARWGTGAGGSRLVTGHGSAVAALEARLARFKRTEAAVVFGSGTLASLGVIPALVGPGDLVLIDALAHSCLMSGAALSGAATVRFAHNDPAALERALVARRPEAGRCLVVTETVFSMDGDRAPLAALAALARAHDAWLLTDDAHGLGVLADGRGGVRAAQEGAAQGGAAQKGVGAPFDVPLQLGTLSKAAGGYGGYLCASAAVVALMHSRARTLVYATGLPPAVAAAADAALAVIEAEPALTRRPFALARRFTARAGLPAATSHIVPVLLGESGRALAWQRWLEEEGFLAVAIRPPTVPDGTARLRLSFAATLDEGAVDRLADLVRDRLSRDGPAAGA